MISHRVFISGQCFAAKCEKRIPAHRCKTWSMAIAAIEVPTGCCSVPASEWTGVNHLTAID
jgi:hypothetical protein